MYIDNVIRDLENMNATDLRAILNKTTELLNSERVRRQREKWEQVVKAITDFCQDYGAICFVDDLERDEIVDFGIDLDYCDLDKIGEIKWIN